MTNHHYVTMLKYKGRIRFTPHYLDPKATKGFEDVIIISKEGQQFVLNNCLFAAISNLCRKMALGQAYFFDVLKITQGFLR